MFRVMRGGTAIGSGLKIKGDVSSEGLVEVSGQIEGDVRCTSLVISPNARIVGTVGAERVVVNGKVEGPIQGGDVVLKSKACRRRYSPPVPRHRERRLLRRPRGTSSGSQRPTTRHA